MKLRTKPKIGSIIFGVALLIFQSLGYIGSINTGVNVFEFSTANGSVFLFDVVRFLSFNIFGIIGIIFILCGIFTLKKRKTPKKTIQNKTVNTLGESIFDINENVDADSDIFDGSEMTEEMTDHQNNNSHTNTSKKQKVRFCKLCGNPINPTTKTCTSCGKQYFKLPRRMLTIALAILLVSSIGVNTFLAIFIKDYISVENETINDLQTELNNKTNKLRSVSDALVSANSQLEAKTEEAEQYKAVAESWKQKYMDNSSSSSTTAYSFSSVTDLLSAIKINPTEYSGKEITVTGTATKDYNGQTYIINSSEIPDATSGVALYSFIRKSGGIEIIISNDIQFSVLQTRDLVKITGTVTIERDEIYLDNCSCTIITPASERK